ncbi:MAG TPA: sugar-binding lipoprotein [Firmicutes bacterium]|nr:sugar-binding lipoprotein [Bacillota bacterium]
MKKRLIPLLALSALGTILASCGESAGTWSWEKASEDKVLNYALLIGQIDHNDSAARTAGIREALGTRPTTHDTNANNEKAVKGSLKLGETTFEVNEVESGEQKSTAGATWDQQTATTTTEAWLNGHDDIDFFVSNNDGMAEGAIGATNWVEGMPIFGYDSNQSTLSYIKEGKIMGTVNQNAPAQAAAIYMTARNAIDGLTDADIYTKGFTEESTKGYGKIASKVTYSDAAHSLLVDNVAVTKDNVESFMTDDITNLAEKGVKKGTTKRAKVWQSYYSESDNFLNSSMQPLFNHYKDLFNFDVTVAKGDGSDDTKTMGYLDSATGYDAYIINMVKTTGTKAYLDKIASLTGATAEAPTSKPVIFWNRQGTKSDGTTDTEVMKDSRFKSIYYVGFDAIQGGKLQGEMIVDYFKDLAK